MKCQLPSFTRFGFREFQSFRQPCFCVPTLYLGICINCICSLFSYFVCAIMHCNFFNCFFKIEKQKKKKYMLIVANFFQILRQICPVFRQRFTKFTKFYQSLPPLPNLSNLTIKKKIIKFWSNLRFTQICRDFKFLWFRFCFHQICIPKKSGLTKKYFFPTLL